MTCVALKMTESEFVTVLETVVKPADSSANIVPLQGYVATDRTVIKLVSFGVISSAEKREALYDVLYGYARENRKIVEYEGWKMNVEDNTFSTVIHNITVKLHKDI